MEDKAFFCNEYANLEVNYGSEGKHRVLTLNCLLTAATSKVVNYHRE